MRASVRLRRDRHGGTGKRAADLGSVCALYTGVVPRPATVYPGVGPAYNGGMWNPILYDDRHAFVWKQGAALLDLLAPQPGEAVLDLGCGTGHLTARIADAGAAVLGVDSSPEMIAEDAFVAIPKEADA